ncbi:MAG: hypothetical protein L0216_14025 [Planctomycetales bacterium]|nr:hypothetical protein [Planctomycetales bacterium]
MAGTKTKVVAALKGEEAAAADLRVRAEGLAGRQATHLVSLLRETESLTRQAALAEVQIGHQREVLDRVKGDVATIGAQKAVLDREAETLRKEKDEREAERAEAEKAVAAAKKELEGVGKDVAKLEKEAAELQHEREKLEQKRERLEGELSRLRKIREDYLSNIAKFRELREEMIN